jgi:hypothetical protein
MIDLYNNTIDLDYMHRLIRFANQRFPEKQMDIFDSFSPNQFISKKELLTTIMESGILSENLSVTMIGSWYASILVPILAPLVKDIVCFDIDEEVSHIASQLHQYENVIFSKQDLTKQRVKSQQDNNDLLFINTACEHMDAMVDVLKLQYTDAKYAPNPRDIWVACQSNNMLDIEGHINCVQSMDEFKMQLPVGLEIIVEKEIVEERGIRYFLFGKLPR